jgi:hypothetical protein
MVIKIEIRGQRKAIEKAQRVLAPQLNQLEQMNEKDARLKIQDVIDEYRLAASIVVNHNQVWSRKRILGNLRRIRDAGRLYGEKTPHRELIGGVLYLPVDTDPILSKYFYEFLHQHCGTAAHYNIHGWITEYPTLDRLKQFFRKNELGYRVLDYIPSGMSDVKRIVEAIEMMLFPLESYVRSKKRASFSVWGERW